MFGVIRAWALALIGGSCWLWFDYRCVFDRFGLVSGLLWRLLSQELMVESDRLFLDGWLTTRVFTLLPLEQPAWLLV